MEIEQLERKLIRLTKYRGGPEKPDYYSSISIERIHGFELFGSYESWGSSWRITLHDYEPKIIVYDRDLGAVITLAERRASGKNRKNQ